MSLEARHVADGTVVEVHGAFDTAEAERLRAVLREIACERPVTLDFHAVRRFDDAAVARLAGEVAERHVALLGLSEHHYRLLRYMGLPRHGGAKPEQA